MDTLLWMAGAAIVLIAGYFYLKQQSIAADKLEAAEHDARSHVVNDSNYNINREGIDGHRDQGLSREEAANAAEDFRTGTEGDIPSREEFHEIRKDLDKS